MQDWYIDDLLVKAVVQGMRHVRVPFFKKLLKELQYIKKFTLACPPLQVSNWGS